MNSKPASGRRAFLKTSTLAAAGGLTAAMMSSCGEEETETVKKPESGRFKISLAQWSLHKALKAGELDNLEFPAVAKNA